MSSHPVSPRRVSIGVLAHDEEERIAATLASVLRQRLVREGRHEVELVVVANGCTDGTVVRAREVLRDASSDLARLSARVVDEPIPGKARAWNRYVHELSWSQADYLMLLDADIELLGDEVLGALVDTLEGDSHALVSTDRPVKDVVHLGGGGLAGRLSGLASQVTGNHPEEGGPTWICGQLYCGRASALRRVWLPVNTMCDDAFVYTMVTTANLTEREDPRRVVLAPAAAHLFEAYLGPSQVLRHQRWILLGQAVNEMVYAELRCGAYDAGEAVRDRNEADPGWLAGLVARHRDELRTREKVTAVATQRVRGLRGRKGAKKLALAPLALGAGAVDAALTWSAHRELRRTGGSRFWQRAGGWGQAS